jgi:hypothetical protein
VISYACSLFDSYYETLIARTIELKDGFLFKYPDFIYEEGGLAWQWGKVEKANSSLFGKDIWIISYVDSKSGRKTIYWIDNERNLKQVQSQFGDRLSIQKPGWVESEPWLGSDEIIPFIANVSILAFYAAEYKKRHSDITSPSSRLVCCQAI